MFQVIYKVVDLYLMHYVCFIVLCERFINIHINIEYTYVYFIKIVL